MFKATEKQVSALHGFYLNEIAIWRQGCSPARLQARADHASYMDRAGVPYWLQNITATAASRLARFPLARLNVIAAGLAGQPAPALSEDEKTIIKIVIGLARREKKIA